LAKNNVGKKPISQEEYTTNKVLAVFSVCLLGVLVLMILERLLGYSNTWKTGVLVTRVLLGVGIVGAAAGIIMLGQEHAGKRSSVRRIVCGRNMLIASIVAIVFLTAINYYGTMPIKAMYVVLPVLAVYYLVYHSYAPEFFLIAVDTGVGVAAMLVIHRALVSANHTWMSTVAAAGTAVLALIQIAVTASLRRKKGKFTFRGCKIDTQFSKNAYLMLTITPIVMVALTAVVVLAASHVMIALGAAAAYLFITAVYYTVKLM
jgi:hypothetical protein